MTLKLLVSLSILWTVTLSCEGANHERISEDLSNEGTSIAASLRTAASRLVVISLENHLNTSMEGGETYLHYGSSPMPAKAEVKPHTRETIVVTAANSLAGVTGIVSYRVADSEESYRFAIVFSVPFNSWFHNNWFGIALIRDSRPVNEDLYNELYNHEAWHEQSRTAQFGYAKKGDVVMITKGSSEITATMSDDARSVIHVVIKKRQEGPLR